MAYRGLSAVDFGHIAAEEEAAALQDYFFETKEFSDVVLEKTLLVVGRKGSGKSAIYVALRDVDFPEKAAEEEPPDQVQLAELRRVLATRFSEEELRTLCFDLNVAYEDLPAEGKAGKSRELLVYLDRRDRLQDLVDLLVATRPDTLESLTEETQPLEYPTSPHSEFMIQLSQILTDHFTEEDLRVLSYRLRIDFENLAGQRIESKARELTLFAARRNLIPELVETLQAMEPRIVRSRLGALLEEIEEAGPAETASVEQSPVLKLERDVVVEGFNLQEYPWEVHKRIRDSGLPKEQAYVSSWTYILWVLLAKKYLSFGEPARYRVVDPLFWKAVFNANIRYLQRFLKQNYGSIAPSLAELLADRARRIRSLKVKDFEVSADSEPSRRLVHSIGYVNQTLQDHVLAVLPSEKTFYLLFDQLDLGWDGTEETKQLLIGLILAARDVVRAAEQMGKQVRVILFLRSDIYDSLRFEDKNKLSPNVVNLKWDKRRLKQLVSKRVRATAGGDWDDAFDGSLIDGTTQLSFIVERTMWRPRDMIQFCICAKEAALRLDRNVIDNESIRAACHPYSHYMSKEIQDECKTLPVTADDLLAILQNIGQERFGQGEFREACEDVGVSSQKTALEQLIDLSMVGVCRSPKQVVFQYQANYWDDLYPTEELVIHPSLIEALGLVEKG